LNGLNTAKIIRDTNSKPRNSEMCIVVLRWYVHKKSKHTFATQ
jgi:hypothetical protein